MSRATRTDAHRPSEIIPANYEIVLSYSLVTSSGGQPVPAYRVNCEADRRTEEVRLNEDGSKTTTFKNGEHAADGRCCVLGLRFVGKVQWAPTGSLGSCSVCGANFLHGDVWRHLPTGEHIHLGHVCADKHEMLADRSAFELERGRREAARLKAIAREQNAEERAAFLLANSGLAEAFALAKEIDTGLGNTEPPFAVRVLLDMAEKFSTYRSLTEKQIAFALKLAEEIRNPRPARVEDAKIAAPTGRLVIRGEVISLKMQEDMGFGSTLKLTIKVTTPEGIWLAWGTCPSGLGVQWDEKGNVTQERVAKGDVVELTGTLTRSDRDPSFAFFKRPSKARIVTRFAAREDVSTSTEAAPAPAPADADPLRGRDLDRQLKRFAE